MITRRANPTKDFQSYMRRSTDTITLCKSNPQRKYGGPQYIQRDLSAIRLRSTILNSRFYTDFPNRFYYARTPAAGGFNVGLGILTNQSNESDRSQISSAQGPSLGDELLEDLECRKTYIGGPSRQPPPRLPRDPAITPRGLTYILPGGISSTACTRYLGGCVYVWHIPGALHAFFVYGVHRPARRPFLDMSEHCGGGSAQDDVMHFLGTFKCSI